jgi:hypothetical protein
MQQCQCFSTVLRDALSGVAATTIPITWDEDHGDEIPVSAEGRRMVRARLEGLADPLWAAARGAARYAQEVPWNCTELRECKNHVELGLPKT